MSTDVGSDCAKEQRKLKWLLNAHAVIAIGVAYGSDRKKYKYGDVLVSKYIVITVDRDIFASKIFPL